MVASERRAIGPDRWAKHYGRGQKYEATYPVRLACGKVRYGAQISGGPRA